MQWHCNAHKIVPVFVAVLLFCTSAGVSDAMANPSILEVQVDPSVPPEYLVINGTGFGTVSDVDQTPVINLGTQVAPLAIPVDQSACNLALNPPPPPLEPQNPIGIDCVVAALPDPIPDGDYRLWLKGEVPRASCEVGKPILLTFQYTGDLCTLSTYPNGTEKHVCTDDLIGQIAPVDIIPGEGKNANKFIVTPNTGIQVGNLVTVTSTTPGKRLASSFPIHIVNDPDSGGAIAQTQNIHTSCSAPLNPDDQFGSMRLEGFIPEGGNLTISDHFDLTIHRGSPPEPPADPEPF